MSIAYRCPSCDHWMRWFCTNCSQCHECCNCPQSDTLSDIWDRLKKWWQARGVPKK